MFNQQYGHLPSNNLLARAILGNECQVLISNITNSNITNKKTAGHLEEATNLDVINQHIMTHNVLQNMYVTGKYISK